VRDLLETVQAHLDREFAVDLLKKLIRVPTEVPLGSETLMAPDDPKLVHYVQDVVRPIMEDAGILGIMEAPLNQVVVRAGTGQTGQSLLVQAYTVTQHQNLTRDPFKPRIATAPEHGVNEPCIFGQGVTQNKAHQAAMITILKALVDSGVELRGTLFFAINNEGRSSHACSEALVPLLDPKPAYGIILIGTGFDISAGNRGRVDVYIHIHGKAAHSSTPWAGQSAIDGANEAINRVRAMKFSKTHPLLGGQHAVVYQVVYSPLAPHTLPDYARLKVDRRLLPGDDIDEAVDEVRKAVGEIPGFRVVVERGVHMLPAVVDAGSEVVRRLCDATEFVRKQRPKVRYQPGAFDAGGPCALGVPTVMWGPRGGDGLLGDDFMPLSAFLDEVSILARLITTWLG